MKKKKKYGHKVSASLKRYYKTDTFKTEKITRYEKIASKRRARLDKSQKDTLVSYLKEGYIRSLLILSKKICPESSYKKIINEFNENSDLKILYKSSISALPYHIQILDLDKWLILKKLIINCEKKEMRGTV